MFHFIKVFEVYYEVIVELSKICSKKNLRRLLKNNYFLTKNGHLPKEYVYWLFF